MSDIKAMTAPREPGQDPLDVRNALERVVERVQYLEGRVRQFGTRAAEHEVDLQELDGMRETADRLGKLAAFRAESDERLAGNEPERDYDHGDSIMKVPHARYGDR